MARLMERPVAWVVQATGRIALDLRRRARLLADDGAQVIGIVSAVCDDMIDALTPPARRQSRAAPDLPA
jgi:hypothetical protein